MICPSFPTSHSTPLNDNGWISYIEWSMQAASLLVLLYPKGTRSVIETLYGTSPFLETTPYSDFVWGRGVSIYIFQTLNRVKGITMPRKGLINMAACPVDALTAGHARKYCLNTRDST